MDRLKQHLKKWLDIPDNNFQAEFEESLRKEIEAVQRDNNFWRSQLKKRTPTKKCLKCKGEIEVWPFNTKVGYHIKGNRVEHAVCLTQTKEDDNGKQ